MTLAGKVAVITGAGSGIGRATALLLAEAEATIGAIDLNPEESQNTVEKIRHNGGEAISVPADISHPEELEQAFDEIYKNFGRIDIVFANAGINGVWAPIDEITPEEWDQTINVNLRGTFLTIKYAVPYMKEQGGSIIVNSSVNGTRTFSNTGATAYACSKAAQVTLAKMVALELANYKIRVNAICPGTIGTSILTSTQSRNLDSVRQPVEFPKGGIPLTSGNAGTPEQVAELVLFLASDAASHISGSEMWIDGTESLLKG